jgi:hypothetical protein
MEDFDYVRAIDRARQPKRDGTAIRIAVRVRKYCLRGTRDGEVSHRRSKRPDSTDSCSVP